jgi:hypothetical protein
MQHFKHAILQQNISILIYQFGSGFFMKGTARQATRGCFQLPSFLAAHAA